MSFCTRCWKESCEGCPVADSRIWPEELQTIATISGIPDCPVCGHRLTMCNPTENGCGWKCEGCDTYWPVGELIAAINQARIINRGGGTNDQGLSDNRE